MNNNGIIESGILDQNLNSTAGTLTLIVTGTTWSAPINGRA